MAIAGAFAVALLLAGAGIAAAASGISIVESGGLYHFQSDNITVTAGSTVTWTDNSDTTHTISSDKLSGPLDGTVHPGGTYQSTFNTVGTYAYHCNIHTYMHGVVHVTAASAPPPTDTAAPSSGGDTGLLLALSAVGSLLLITAFGRRLRRRNVRA